MNYAWEAALAADRGGIPRESLRYVPVKNEVRPGKPYSVYSCSTWYGWISGRG